MKILKRIIALFCSIAISFSLLVLPAMAVPLGTIVEGASAVVSFADFAFNMYDRWKENHPNEPDSAYTGFTPGGSFGGGAGRRDHFEEDYKNYVSTLPATGFNSVGHVIWRPTLSDVLRVSYSGVMGKSPTIYDIDSLPSFLTPLDKGNGFFFKGTFNAALSAQPALYGILFQCEFSVPTTGEYKLLSATRAVGEIFYSDAPEVSCYDNYSESSSFVSLDAGKKVWTPSTRYFTDYCVDKKVTRFSYNWYLPVFEIIPGSMSDEYDKYYNIVSRPTSISGGNYGIVGDNGQITKVENNSTIVNETNNTYYNPATGQTQPITNWAYDYSDRSYTLTLEGGKTSTVTYGDEYITIEEGDTVYNVYYVVDGSGTENPPAACTHDWQETSTTPATCTVSGSKLLTCSKCQQTKAETLPALGHNWQETKSTPATCTVPGSKVRTCSRCQQTETETLSALGHDWQVKQTVTTQYDDTGQLTQQGYTIFECSRCHEQYKSTDGVVPPGGSGTDSGGEGDTTIGGLIEKLLSGLGGVLSGIIKGLLALLTQAVEAISGIGELFTSFVGSLVGLWGGFTDFLAAVFPFLPAEFITIVELGLILMIAVAVFKKFVS